MVMSRFKFKERVKFFNYFVLFVINLRFCWDDLVLFYFLILIYKEIDRDLKREYDFYLEDSVLLKI